MFTTLSLKNFRGFKEIHLSELRRFNLFLGQNNVGKTALLEGVFLLLGPTNPNLTLTINAFRGVEQFRTDPEDIWGWMFHDKDLSKTIKVEARVDGGSKRTLQITVEEPTDLRLGNRRTKTSRKQAFSAATTQSKQNRLVMKLNHESGREATTGISQRKLALG